MHEPAQQDDPERTGEKEMNDGHNESTLKELAESWDEEAAECGDDVSSGALSSHVLSRSWYVGPPDAPESAAAHHQLCGRQAELASRPEARVAALT